MRKTIYVLTFTATLLFTGCAQKPQTSWVQRDDIDIISNHADTQMTFLKKQGNLERYCAARESDVIETTSSGFNIGGGSLGQTGNIGEGTAQGALSLGGRDPAVLIVREIMYRACELTMNLNTNKEDTIDIYLKFMQIMTDIAKNQQGTGVKALSQSTKPITKIKETTVNPQSKNQVTTDTKSDTISDDLDSTKSDSGLLD